MKLGRSMNTIGIFITFILIVFIQLLWLFDPIRIGESMYWIDLLEYIIYFSAIIPLLWLSAAIRGIVHLGWREEKVQKLAKILLLGIRIIISLSSLTAIWFIGLDPNQGLLIAVLVGFSFLLIYLDKILMEYFTQARVPWRGIGSFIVSIIIMIILLYPTSYIVTYPGLTLNMNTYAEVEGGIKKGELTGVLIFERPAFPIDWLYAQWFPIYEFEKRKETDLPLFEQLHQVRMLQLNANQIGSSVAFKRAGIGVGYTMDGVLITGLLEDSSAAEQLIIGDVITMIDGLSIENTDVLMMYMSTVVTNKEIELVVRRNLDKVAVTLETLTNPENPQKIIMGVHITNNIQLDLPLQVHFQSYFLYKGGPSHGSMLALSLLDQLTPGGVTNGNHVAGTGTIDIDGRIGPIGGIKQKARLVQRAGADVFFVPAGQLEDAREGAAQLNIVPVHTLDDMLIWLNEHPGGVDG